MDTPFPNENERFIHQLEILLFQGLHCEGGGELNPSLDRLNQDRKKGKKSAFERNLNVALTPSSTSLRVKPAIPSMLSLNFEKKEE